MKNMVMLSAILAVVSVPAAAVQKCVALGRGTTCEAPRGLSQSPTGKTDWKLTCTTNRESVTVSGIGVCSASSGTTSSPVDSLTTSRCFSAGSCPASGGDALYCWCRMLSPVLSQWVAIQMSYASESECLYNCAATCYQNLIDEQTFRTALFSTSTLSD